MLLFWELNVIVIRWRYHHKNVVVTSHHCRIYIYIYNILYNTNNVSNPRGTHHLNSPLETCVPEVIIAQLDPLIWLNAIFWWLHQHKAAIMLVADSFPHLNNSISGAASPAQGPQRTGDWQIRKSVIHETRWAWAEQKEPELEVERQNLSGLVLSSLITPLSLFPPFPCFIFFLLRWRLSWRYWTQFPWRMAEPKPFHHFIHPWGKGAIMTSYPGW